MPDHAASTLPACARGVDRGGKSLPDGMELVVSGELLRVHDTINHFEGDIVIQ
jgi:hypothetical protein